MSHEPHETPPGDIIPTSRWHRDSRLLTLLVRVPSTLAVAYFVFWGCAPVMSLPPPVPLPEGLRSQVGGGVSYSLGSDGEPANPNVPAGIDGQIWYLRQALPNLDFGLQVYGGATSILGGGGLVRARFVQNERFNLGAQLSGGWLWLDVGLPVSVKLGNGTWVYTHPTFGYRGVGLARIPLGVSLEASPAFRVNLELGVNLWAGTLGLLTGTNSSSTTFYGSMSTSFHF